MVTRTPWIKCNTDLIVCMELYSAVLMLELLTKEYIVASILAWLQTLYFLFKVRRGHEIKKKKQPLAYSTTDMEIHVFMFPEA